MSQIFPSDNDLLAGCLEGRKESWDSFVERFSKLIYWGIHKTLEDSSFQGRTELVDEIFQEVFKQLLEPQRLKSLRDLKGLRKFLTVMACHLTMDKIRHLSFFEKKSVSTETDFFEEGSLHDPATGAATKERDLIIGEVLGKLPARERACVEFHFLDEKSHREIGEILGMPQDTVSTVIRRTKEKLRADFIRKGIKDL